MIFGLPGRLVRVFFRSFGFEVGSQAPLGADLLYEFVECVPDRFFWLGFGLVGSDHTPGFANGVDYVAISCAGVVDDLFESVEEFLAGEAGVLAVVLLKGLQIFLSVFSLKNSTGVAGGAFDGAAVPGVEPGLADL